MPRTFSSTDALNASTGHANAHANTAYEDEANAYTRFQHVNHPSSQAGLEMALKVTVDTGHADGARERFGIENNAASQLVDINLRGATVNLGDSSSSVSAQGTLLKCHGPAGDVSNPIQVFQAGSDTVTTFYVSRNGGIISNSYGLASTHFRIGADGEANSRFDITDANNGGTLRWGAGGASAVDTTLYRSAADTLKTDDSFHVGATLRHLGSSLGFFNAAAATQPTTIVDADGTLADITTKFNSLLSKLETLGLLASA